MDGDGKNGGMGLPTEQLDVRELVHQHHRMLYAYAYRMSGSAADAEDLVQQAFLALQEKGHQIRDRQSVRSWLFTVIRNNFLKDCRRKAPQLAENVELDLSQVPQIENDEVWFDSERLQMAIDELPAQYRIVLVMFYFEDSPYKEIAEKLDMPVGTVMSRLSRAKARLRASLLQPVAEPPTASI